MSLFVCMYEHEQYACAVERLRARRECFRQGTGRAPPRISEWEYRYGGAPVSRLYNAGSELRAAKVIPASHFALHLVFIFQAIKPAARRWRVCVCDY